MSDLSIFIFGCFVFAIVVGVTTMLLYAVAQEPEPGENIPSNEPLDPQPIEAN